MREDFFYRIHVIPINLPPLRERREDIPLLLEHFFKLHSVDGKASILPGHLIESLTAHDWPGNVRELQNTIQRRYLAVKHVEFIPSPSSKPSQSGESPYIGMDHNNEEDFSLFRCVEDAEKGAIRKALNRCGGNRTRAARVIRVSRKTLLRKMKRLELS